MTRISPALRAALIRAGRTFAQAFLGTYMAMVITTETDTVSALADGTALEAGAVAGVIALLSLFQNVIENGWASYDRG